MKTNHVCKVKVKLYTFISYLSVQEVKCSWWFCCTVFKNRLQNRLAGMRHYCSLLRLLQYLNASDRNFRRHWTESSTNKLKSLISSGLGWIY